jgi:methylated-DNA-[protein]-cysteine S-methyltransferase
MFTQRHHTFESPIGTLMLTMTARGLAGVHMEPFTLPPGSVVDQGAFRDAEAQLRAYFAGELRHFDLTLDQSGTPFQLRAWRALQSIPYGCTLSYAQQAAQMGQPRASRAVGAANGRNPISIVVPCHRVIGASGRLTGFGGGLDRKQFLLDLERRHTVE